MTRYIRTRFWTCILGCALLASWLAGCSATQLFNEGMSDINAGRLEVGLAKMEDAVKKDPDSAFLKTQLRMTRQYVVQRVLQEADAARAASDFTGARRLYEHVLELDKANAQALAGLESTKNAETNQLEIRMAKDLIGHNELNEAQAQLGHILSTDPNNIEAKQMLDRILSQNPPPEPVKPKLRLKEDRIALLQFRESPLGMVFEALSRTSGINFVLDKDVKSETKTNIFVKDMLIESALDMVLAQHALDRKLLADNIVLIYPDTPDKRRRYEEQMVKSFHLTNADPKQAMNLLKVMLDTKSLFIDEHARLLVMRDTPEVVRMAEKLLISLDLEDSEVMMEVEIVEITRSKLTEIGIKYPNQVTLTALGPAGDKAVQTLQSLIFDRAHTGMSSLAATINLKREDSNVNILSSPRIRARNYEKAKIHIGDRVPVFTNAVTPLATGAPVVTGSVTYLDVGLKFEVEPTIYWDDEVSMKLNLDVSSIVKEVTSGTSLSYQIGTRSASTVLRLRDGETQILAGLISDADRETASKVPGLSSFPILGRLFSSEKIDKSKQEIALSITPHVIRHGRRPNIASSEILYGTESSRGIPLTVKMSENERKSPRDTKGAAGLPANETMGAAVVGNLSEGPSQNEPASATASVGEKKANSLKAVTVPAATGNPPESPARNELTPAPDPERTKKSAAEDASEVPANNEPAQAEGAESAGQVP
ncbi:MAG: general secretion pathway protein GspD [Nitrospira sp.]|nr:general secretion pathway protein GspD [Nitrospira sp.]TKB74560.1 MAG: general secretion pathway protein GspD [Nitrospira sp.]